MKQFNNILKAITLVILFVFSAQTITAQEGDWEWLLAAGIGGNDWANGMVRDQQENLYITGAFTHTAIFGKDTLGNTVTLISLPNSLERFVAKYNKVGQCLWVKSICNIKANNSNRKGSIAIDNLGNLFVGGTIYGDVIDGTDTLLHYQRGVYSFVSSFSQQDGNLQWIRIAGSDSLRNETLVNESYCFSVCADNNGGVYSTGQFIEEMYIDSTANDKIYVAGNTLTYSTFLFKYDNSGNLQWKRLVKGNTAWGVTGVSVKTNSQGNVFVTGNVSGNQYIETDGQGGLDSLITDPYTAQYLISDVFILKYSPNGIFMEKTRIGGENRQSPNDLFIDQYDNMFITGNFQYYANFSGNTVTAEGSTDIFILKLDTSFNLQWDKYIQGVGEEIASYVIANDNNVYITGYFDNTIYFTETDYTTNDSLRDIFIAKYDKADGTFLSALQAGGTLNDEGWGIAVDDCENIYATGYFTSPSYFDDDTLSGSTYREIFLGKYNVHYADFILDSSICPNIPFNLATTNLAPTQYALNWSTAETDSNQISISPSITTSYVVTVSDADGCTASDRAIISILDSSFCYVKLQDAYCNIVNISPDKTLYADTIQGAEMYEFWVYNENENYTLKSYDNSLALYKIQTLGSGQTYNVKVRIMKNEIWGEWGNACTISITTCQLDGELVYSTNPSEFDELNGKYYKEPMKVFDRFGEDYTLDEISVENRADKYGEQVFGSVTPYMITAGIFELYIDDVTYYNPNDPDNPPIGFNDTLYGIERQKTLAQVFLDLSELIGKDMGTEKIRINIKESQGMPQDALGGASQYMEEGNGGLIKKGYIELFIQTGIDPAPSSLFHGYIIVNFKDYPWKSNIEGVIGNEHDLYSVMLHESMHLLGFASLFSDYSGKGVYNSFSLFDANMVYKKNNDYIPILVEEDNQYVLNDSVVLNEGCNSSTLFYKNKCALFNEYTTIYNPPTYQSGSSLSHFNCEGVTQDYVMNYSSSVGTVQRNLHEDEVSVLHDLEYSMNNKYGSLEGKFYINNVEYDSYWEIKGYNDSDYIKNQLSEIALEFYDSCNNSSSFIKIIGVNDPYDYKYLLNNEKRYIHVGNLLSNDKFEIDGVPFDENNKGICNVKVISGAYLLSTNDEIQQNGIIEFIPFASPNIVLSYQPYDKVTEKKGTAAYVIITTQSPPYNIYDYCNSDSYCNLICGGDFEGIPDLENFYCGSYAAFNENGQYIHWGGWDNSPDRFIKTKNINDSIEKVYIHSSSSQDQQNTINNNIANTNLPMYGGYPEPQSGMQYMGIMGGNNVEGICLLLKENLEINTEYNFSFWYNTTSNNAYDIKSMQIYGMTDYPNETSMESQPNATLLTTLELNGIGNWQYVTTKITATQSFKYLIFVGKASSLPTPYLFVDNISLTKDNLPISISPNFNYKEYCISSPSDSIITEEIEYTFTNPNNDSVENISIKANIIAGEGLKIIANNDFNSDGTANLAIGPNNTIAKTLKVEFDYYVQDLENLITIDIAQENAGVCFSGSQNKVILVPKYDMNDIIILEKNAKYQIDNGGPYIEYTLTIRKKYEYSNVEIKNLNFLFVLNSYYLFNGSYLFNIYKKIEMDNPTLNNTIVGNTNHISLNNNITLTQSDYKKDYKIKCYLNDLGCIYVCIYGDLNDTFSITEVSSCVEAVISNNDIITVSSVTANAGDDHTICSGDTTTLTATGDGDTYSWSTAATTSSINVSPTATTTYTVTATKDACSATDAVVVTIGHEAITWYNINAKTIIQNNLFPQGEKTVRINDSLLVDTTLTLDDYTLRISSWGKIIIKERGKLILNRCTLEAGQCLNDSMWAGIFLEGTYKIDTITVEGVPYITKITDTLLNASISIDSSIIRDAFNAIKSTNGGAIEATNSTFENNERNIIYKEHYNLYWERMPMNLVLEGNKFVNNSESITTLSGIEVSDVNTYVQVMIYPFIRNEFDNLQKGIVIKNIEYAYTYIPAPEGDTSSPLPRGNIVIGNCFFENIGNFAIDIDSSQQIVSMIENCEITNSYAGINIKNTDFVEIKSNDISTARNCIRLTDIDNVVFIGGYGYTYDPNDPSSNNLTINDEINPPSGGSEESMEYDAILFANTQLASMDSVVYDFNISNNNINVKNGINAISIYNMAIKDDSAWATTSAYVVSYNTIKMDSITSECTRRGIHLNNCYGGLVTKFSDGNIFNNTALKGNVISRLNPTAPSDENIIGILSNVTSAFNIKSNIINQAGKAIRMLGESEKNKLSCNEMTNCDNGVYFDAAVIDDQGDTLASTCNEWNSVTDLQRVTGSINNYNRVNWYYRNSITEEDPKIDEIHPLFFKIYPRPQAASCVCVSTKSNKGSNKPKLQTKSDTLIAIRQYLLEPTVKGTLSFEKYNDEYVYQYNKKAMRILANNPELISINGADDNNLYENFYNKHINSNIGEFLSIENTIKKSSVSTRGAISEKKQQARTAKQLNSRINPGNLLEAYQQTVNNVLLNMAEGKEIDEATRSELIAIAKQKAYVYGDAVFQARVLLGINFVDEEEESTDNNMENKIGEESTPKNYQLSIINSQFNIYPNPSNGEIIVEYTGDSLCNATFELYNIYGSKLIEEKINSKKQRINLRNLENAVYFYQINNCNIIENRNKLIINK